MCIYHTLIDALNAHLTIHIYLNTIFYTHVKRRPTNAINVKYYLKQKQNKK